MKFSVLLILLSCAASQAIAAHEPGAWIVRVGAADVSPDDSSDGIAVPALGLAPIAGTAAEVDSEIQVGLTVTYMMTSTFGIELLAATPFTHKVTADLDGFSAGLKVPAGSVKHLPPTLSVVYYPLGDSNSRWQPYAGAGINYTLFFEEDVRPELEALTGTLAGLNDPMPLSLKLDNSFGLALQLGVDYQLQNNWSLNAAVRWINIETEAQFNSSLGNTISVDNVDISPFVYQLTLGYSF